MTQNTLQPITDDQLAKLEQAVAESMLYAVQIDTAHISALIARLRAAENKLRAWEPIMDEVDRRADKEHCLADRCDFTVTVCYDDYAAIDAAMHQG